MRPLQWSVSCSPLKMHVYEKDRIMHAMMYGFCCSGRSLAIYLRAMRMKRKDAVRHLSTVLR